MLFDYDLIVPAGTPASTPVMAKARLIRGKLTEIRVKFPPGPATLVHVAVRDRLYQLMPANPEGDVNVDEAVVSSVMEYDIIDDPFELDLIGWSPDAVFEHTITFQFEMQPVTGQNWTDFIATLFKTMPRPTRGA